MYILFKNMTFFKQLNYLTFKVFLKLYNFKKIGIGIVMVKMEQNEIIHFTIIRICRGKACGSLQDKMSVVAEKHK